MLTVGCVADNMTKEFFVSAMNIDRSTCEKIFPKSHKLKYETPFTVGAKLWPKTSNTSYTDDIVLPVSVI